MLYLDATAAVRSPSNYGIPRTTRRLYEALRQLGPVTPVVWSEPRQTYCLLSVSEQRFLEQPFARHSRPLADPTAVGRRLLSGLERWFSHRRNALSFEQLCQPGHTLLIPDVCDADRRRDWLRRAAADGRLRLVAVFHDAIPCTRPDLARGFNVSDYRDYLHCLARLHTIITCSNESREVLAVFWREGGCAPSPIIVEPWPTEFGPRGQADPAQFDAHRALFVSSFDPRKNHLTLFAACEKLWDAGLQFELELIGRVRAQGVSLPVEDAIRRMERERRPVRWLGHVADNALVDAYRQCSFTVYPSLVEGFGLPIHESLWFGRPCVCGTNGALGEVSAGGGCLPCDQTNAASLAAAMRQLLTDRALYEKLSREAEQRQFRSWVDYARALRSHLVV